MFWTIFSPRKFQIFSFLQSLHACFCVKSTISWKRNIHTRHCLYEICLCVHLITLKSVFPDLSNLVLNIKYFYVTLEMNFFLNLWLRVNKTRSHGNQSSINAMRFSSMRLWSSARMCVLLRNYVWTFVHFQWQMELIYIYWILPLRNPKIFVDTFGFM